MNNNIKFAPHHQKCIYCFIVCNLAGDFITLPHLKKKITLDNWHLKKKDKYILTASYIFCSSWKTLGSSERVEGSSQEQWVRVFLNLGECVISNGHRLPLWLLPPSGSYDWLKELSQHDRTHLVFQNHCPPSHPLSYLRSLTSGCLDTCEETETHTNKYYILWFTHWKGT